MPIALLGCLLLAFRTSTLSSSYSLYDVEAKSFSFRSGSEVSQVWSDRPEGNGATKPSEDLVQTGFVPSLLS